MLLFFSDQNDNFPAFSQPLFFGHVLAERRHLEQQVLQLRAHDPDEEREEGLRFAFSAADRRVEVDGEVLCSTAFFELNILFYFQNSCH
jgi:hypothetical protein